MSNASIYYRKGTNKYEIVGKLVPRAQLDIPNLPIEALYPISVLLFYHWKQMNTDYPITYITFITTTNNVKYGNFKAYYLGAFGASLSKALVNPFAITRRISIVVED